MSSVNFKTTRLTREHARLQKTYEKCGGIEAHLRRERWCAQMTDSVTLWTAKLWGAKDTPYEDHEYELILDFATVDYPSMPPKVRFVRKIPFHANVYNDGKICVDILQSEWAPSYKIADILVSVVSMLNEPNTASPANGEAATAYDQDTSEGKKNFTLLVQSHYEK